MYIFVMCFVFMCVIICAFYCGKVCVSLHLISVVSPGYLLSVEDTNETLELYFEWILQNNFDGCDVPFAVFEEWFTQLASRIVRNKNMSTDFNINEFIETYAHKQYNMASSRQQNDGDKNSENCQVQ